MQLPMMTAAERDGELVADFETERSGLGKAQVMRIARLRPQIRHPIKQAVRNRAFSANPPVPLSCKEAFRSPIGVRA